MHHIRTQLSFDFGVLFKRWIKQLMIKHNVKNDFVYANIVLIFSDFFVPFTGSDGELDPLCIKAKETVKKAY